MDGLLTVLGAVATSSLLAVGTMRFVAEMLGFSVGSTVEALTGEVWESPLVGYQEKADFRKFVNIGVVGPAGVGKSSLVNALRRAAGLEPEAAVGCVETTKTPTPYHYSTQAVIDAVKSRDPAGPAQTDDSETFETTASPDKDESSTTNDTRKQVRIWDLPGSGTTRFPIKSYCLDMGLNNFDVLVVVSARRFTEMDRSLLTSIQAQKVPCFVVRSMVDVDVRNELRDHGRSEADTLSCLATTLREKGARHPFLVSSRCADKYDLRRLMSCLVGAVQLRVVGRDGCPCCRNSVTATNLQCATCGATYCAECTRDLFEGMPEAQCPGCMEPMRAASWPFWMTWIR
jgi:predicted GTPase